MDIRVLFLFFMIYSFLGWIMETLICSYMDGKIVNRGFFIGPYLPIFGIGAVVITLLLSSYSNDIFVLFIMSSVLGAALEYIASYLLEKIFHTRWWNWYHHKFNLNGRTCLFAAIGFGILGVMMIMFFNPFIFSIINGLSVFYLNLISLVLALVFITDMIISFKIISGITSEDFGKAKDTTEEVSKKVREILKEKSILSKRLFNAFPDLKIKYKK